MQCAQAAKRPSRRRAAPTPACPSHGQHEPAPKRNAVRAGCTAGRSRARAGAPTLSCPRVGAPLERPRCRVSGTVSAPDSAPVALGPGTCKSVPGAQVLRRGTGGPRRAPPELRPPPGAPGPRAAPRGLPGPEVHSARRPRQGGLAEAPAPRQARFTASWLHTSWATHTRRGARCQGAGGSTCLGSRACMLSPTADLAGRAGRCVGATWPPVGLCMGPCVREVGLFCTQLLGRLSASFHGFKRPAAARRQKTDAGRK